MWLADWLTVTGWLIGWRTDWMCDWLTDCMTGRLTLTDHVTGWLTDVLCWLAGWLILWHTKVSDSVDRSTTAVSHITVSQLIQKFPTSYKKWNFISLFTKSRKVALARAILGQSTTHILSFFQLHYNFIVPSKIRSCIWSLSSRSSRQNSVVFSFLHVPHVPPITSYIRSS